VAGATPDSEPADSRRPRGLYAQGSEPDARFSLANERTALAWVRTALAFVAGGVGLTSLGRIADLGAVVDYVAAVMCVIGGFVAVSSMLGWRRKELALRTGRPLPAPVALPWLAGSVTVIGLVLAVVVAALAR
jgi:putative membrane protein